MNQERLGIYLDDHLAFIIGEIELVERCQSNNQGTSLGHFLKRLKHELQAQKGVLETILQRVGGKGSIRTPLKQGVAWMAEKLGRLKRNDSLLTYSPLSRVLELEMLTVAAQQRTALWDNLYAALEVTDRELDFNGLRKQAHQHFEDLNARRRLAAAEAFGCELA